MAVSEDKDGSVRTDTYDRSASPREASDTSTVSAADRGRDVSARLYTRFVNCIIDAEIADARARFLANTEGLRWFSDGAEACRGKTPEQLVAMFTDLSTQATDELQASDGVRSKRYWRLRWGAVVTEWVLDILSVGCAHVGLPPFLAHLPSDRGIGRYARLIEACGAACADVAKTAPGSKGKDGGG